jgi:hypothetical protein
VALCRPTCVLHPRTQATGMHSTTEYANRDEMIVEALDQMGSPR